jgi:hypothetical protein
VGVFKVTACKAAATRFRFRLKLLICGWFFFCYNLSDCSYLKRRISSRRWKMISHSSFNLNIFLRLVFSNSEILLLCS